jgi:hypothetical protein
MDMWGTCVRRKHWMFAYKQMDSGENYHAPPFRKDFFFVLLVTGDFSHWRWQAPFTLPPFLKIAFAQVVIYVVQVVRSCMSLDMSNAARQEHDDENWGFMIY